MKRFLKFMTLLTKKKLSEYKEYKICDHIFVLQFSISKFDNKNINGINVQKTKHFDKIKNAFKMKIMKITFYSALKNY